LPESCIASVLDIIAARGITPRVSWCFVWPPHQLACLLQRSVRSSGGRYARGARFDHRDFL